MKFRKKPVVVEAYQITTEMLEGAMFHGKPYPKGLRLSSASTNVKHTIINNWQGYVTTIHDQRARVVEGDWIIDEGDGEHFYPCKPDIFERTYEAV